MESSTYLEMLDRTLELNQQPSYYVVDLFGKVSKTLPSFGRLRLGAT